MGIYVYIYIYIYYKTFVRAVENIPPEKNTLLEDRLLEHRIRWIMQLIVIIIRHIYIYIHIYIYTYIYVYVYIYIHITTNSNNTIEYYTL